jgi:hypothetical protein
MVCLRCASHEELSGSEAAACVSTGMLSRFSRVDCKKDRT